MELQIFWGKQSSPLCSSCEEGIIGGVLPAVGQTGTLYQHKGKDLLDLQITILVSFSGFITVTWDMVAEVLNINVKK